jgi:hypothetical protein
MTTGELPHSLLANLPESAQTKVRVWWEKLSQEQHLEFHMLYDSRRERITYMADILEDALVWNELPIWLQAKVVDREDARDAQLAHQHEYEYFVNHEIFLVDRMAFHVGCLHSLAQNVMRKGVLPVGFVCPRANSSCPLRTAQHVGAKTPTMVFQLRVPKHTASNSQRSVLRPLFRVMVPKIE